MADFLLSAAKIIIRYFLRSRDLFLKKRALMKIVSDAKGLSGVLLCFRWGSKGFNFYYL